MTPATRTLGLEAGVPAIVGPALGVAAGEIDAVDSVGRTMPSVGRSVGIAVGVTVGPGVGLVAGLAVGLRVGFGVRLAVGVARAAALRLGLGVGRAHPTVGTLRPAVKCKGPAYGTRIRAAGTSRVVKAFSADPG